MVEFSVLLEPLFGFFGLVGVHQSLVNKLQIFGFSLGAYELVSFFVDWRVVKDKSKPIPSLLDFGVH